MAILIDPKGLLWGKRLRKLSNKARLFYPLMLGLTNFYARIELDEPCILSNFNSFRDSDLTEENLALWFNEYTDAGLSFLYKAGTQTWIQFDTPLAMRKNFPTAEDKASPAPPEAEYATWLQSIHGDKWKDYDLTNYQKERQSDISDKRAMAGRKGAAATNAKRWGTDSESQQNQQTDFADSANRQSHLGVVLGAVEGEDVVEGEGEGVTLNFNLKSEAESVITLESSLTKSGTGKTKTEAPVKGSANGDIPAPKDGNASAAAPVASLDADLDLDAHSERFAVAWGRLMQRNPKFDPARLPANSKKLWVADFRKLLDVYPIETVDDLMVYSQSEKQRDYNWNCKAFCTNCERNVKFMENVKKTSLWKPMVDRCIAIVTTGNLPPDELDDDTLCTTCGEPWISCPCPNELADDDDLA